MKEIEISALEDIPENKPWGFERDGLALVLIRKGNEVFALEDVCSHMEVPLSFGTMVEEYVIQCLAHGARFDIRSGKNLSFPAVTPVRSYKTEVREGKVYVKIED